VRGSRHRGSAGWQVGVLPVAEVGASAPRTSAERAAEEAPIRRVRALRQAACCALRPRAAKPARVRLFPESPQPSTGELGYRDSRRHLLLIDPPPQGRKRERTCGVACRVGKARRNTATCPIEHACARGVPCTLFWGSRYIQGSALGCPLIGWADAAAHCASEWSALCDQTSQSAHISCSLAATARLASCSFCSAAASSVAIAAAAAACACAHVVHRHGRAEPSHASSHLLI
jgi:hypothetical protein